MVHGGKRLEYETGIVRRPLYLEPDQIPTHMQLEADDRGFRVGDDDLFTVKHDLATTETPDFARDRKRQRSPAQHWVPQVDVVTNFVPADRHP